MTAQLRTSGTRARTRMSVLASAAALLAYSTMTTAGARPEGPQPPDGPAAATPAASPRLTVTAAPSGRLGFSSYLGGREWDEATGVATDREGNAYVTGFTRSRDFPRAGAASRGFNAIVDVFLTKVDPARGRVVWSTHLGGMDMDMANAVAVDAANNVYVAGRTGSPDFPTRGGVQGRLRGRACTGQPCHDAFVAKFDASGRLRWSTLFGGSRNEEVVSVAVGGDGTVYLAGLTDSPDLPVRRPLQRSFQSLPCTGDLPCPYDAFVAKLAPSGGRIVYSTYLGGSATDLARGIAVDGAGSAYVVGSTGSPDFPTVRAFQRGMGGEACGPPPGEPCRQAFLTKLTPRGGAAVFSTYLGGTEHDDAYGVALDGRGRAHVTGSTQSSDFPTRRALQGALRNGACFSEQPLELCDDGFVTKFTRSGGGVVYSTYLGGRAEDQGLAVDVTVQGQALVGGRTDSSNFPVTAGAAQSTFGGYIDGFATKLRGDGTAAWSTFLGGTDADRATGVAADRGGAAHVVGRTLSPDFPTVRPFQPALKDDDYDAFVGRLD